MESKTRINTWVLEEQPREKLIALGKRSLTNSELLAILLRTGSKGRNAITLARELLQVCNQDLSQLVRLTIDQLTDIPGIGLAKAVTIQSAFELGIRAGQVSTSKVKITCPQDSYDLIRPEIYGLSYEVFWVVFLNQGNLVVGKELVSRGGISSTVVDPRWIFKLALEKLATSIILVHNHPSGNLAASAADRKVTSEMIAAGKLLKIKVLDHLIATDEGYFSMSEHNMM